MDRNCLPFRSTRVHLLLLVGFVLFDLQFFYVCFVDRCLSFCPLSIVLSVLRFTDSDCPFGILKLLLVCFLFIFDQCIVCLYYSFRIFNMTQIDCMNESNFFLKHKIPLKTNLNCVFLYFCQYRGYSVCSRCIVEIVDDYHNK